MSIIDDLYNKFSGNADNQNQPDNSTSTPPSIPRITVRPQGISSPPVDDLYNKFSNTSDDAGVAPPATPGMYMRFGAGALQGVKDVINTTALAIGYIDRALNGEAGQKRSDDYNQRLTQQNQEFDQSAGTPEEFGRMGGQMLATAPLIPAKIFQGANVLARATPTILQSGEKLAAPLMNRVAGLGLGGSVAGTESNALTHAARNDTSLPVDLATGAATGAVAAPIVQGTANATVKALQATRNLWGSLQVSRLAADTGISANSAKNIIDRLQEAGYKPQDALAALKTMGPKATLADLDESLTTEASGLASLGGKPTALLKGTFADRAATADNSAVNILQQRLGPKPDVQALKDNIIQDARNQTRADYTTAHNSTDKIDVSGVASDIDSSLKTAVGSKARELATAKGYLFRTDKDAAGNTVNTLKDDVKSLHEVRQALDDTLERLPKEGTSQKSSTYRAVNEVRGNVDAALKTNPELARADAIFANRAGVAKGVDYGYQAFQKGTKEEFTKIWNVATPEIKDTIRSGMKAAAYDALESAQRGEMSGAQRLFGKKSVNREKLKLAFGNDADEVLNELSKEASFRQTENLVNRGAATAERLAVQKRYEGSSPTRGLLSDAAKGIATDAATGSLGAASSVMALRHIGTGARNRLMEVTRNNLAEGSADLLSRQGAMRDSGLQTLVDIQKIRDAKIGNSGPLKTTLPVRVSEPIANYIKNKYENMK